MAQNRGLRLGSLMGIRIYLDFSLIIIFSLLVWHLGANVLPSWHADWSPGLRWMVGASAAILFFASLLAHEMAHSLVALRLGISVPRITLFLFGGIAEIAEEPDTPRKEFLIAIVGPLTSLALGVLFSSVGTFLAGPEFAVLWAEDQEAALAGLSPLATMFLWLGPINILLGVFNMVPGFPLDGGRVLRAGIWWLTGDLGRATRMASDAGRLFGWLLMALGIFQALSGAFLEGLWLLLIGWFLTSAAASSYAQLTIRQALKGHTAKDMMRKRFETVDAELPVSSFIDDHLLQSTQVLWPVVRDRRAVGFVTLEQVKAVAAESRDATTLGDVMLTNRDDFAIDPETDAVKAVRILGNRTTPLAVMTQDQVVGLLSQTDLVKWLAFHQQ